MFVFFLSFCSFFAYINKSNVEPEIQKKTKRIIPNTDKHYDWKLKNI